MKLIFFFICHLGIIPFTVCILDRDHTIKHEIDSLKNWQPSIEKDIFKKKNILEAKQIPVICYHNIRDHLTGNPNSYTIGANEFRTHMKMLSDSGYHTILPDELILHLTAGRALPQKPVMITFDDSHVEHFTIAAPILNEYGFKGVFFIMTVTIGKQGYLSAHQIKRLSDEGHIIGCHTWDHQNLKKLDNGDWELQIRRPKFELEKITGHEVPYFAYPFGTWNQDVVTELKRYGIKAAFQLADKQSEKEPLYTIRRLLVPGDWTAKTLDKRIYSMF